jgi:hypothetical protein
MLDWWHKIECLLFSHQWSNWRVNPAGSNYVAYRFCQRPGCGKVESQVR